VAALCVVAAVAWVGAVQEALVMGNGPGNMGLGAWAFLAMWALMMAEMMLLAPVASLYSRTVRTARAWRLIAFTGGYLVVWAAAGAPAYALVRGTGALAAAHPAAARGAAAGLLAVAGAWQLSGPKDRCLAHCRSPISALLRYASYQGRLRDLKASVHHAAFCSGCCWALMALLAVFGVMNIGAMVVLATVVLLEKLWGRGAGFSRFVGAACSALGVATLFAPALTPELHAHTAMHM
jgi:predicted metal-binding membrane protein